eukprot:2150157-Alexandrium_andersonii.AAC.1
MSASLVGSEMCIRDRPERVRVDEDSGASPEPGREPAPRGGRGRSAEYEHSEVVVLAPQDHH